MPVKLRLSWEHQLLATVICHNKMFPDKVSERSPNVKFSASKLLKLPALKVSEDLNPPPPRLLVWVK